MNDAMQELVVDAIRYLLKNPSQFVETYQTPLGENWKHVLWDFAQGVVAAGERQRAAELHAFKVEHGLKELDDLVAFVRDHACKPLEQMQDDFLALDMEATSLRKEVQHLTATLRAVEQTLNLTVGRLNALVGVVN